MSASIQSKQFYEFDCSVKEHPVLTFNNFLVFELVDSAFPNDIIKKVNGEYAGTFRHVALDSKGNGYLFDFKNKKMAGNLGLCDYIKL